MDDGMSMASTFSSWSSYKIDILFKFWSVDTEWEFTFSCIAISFAVIMYHAMRYLVLMVEDSMVIRGTERTSSAFDVPIPKSSSRDGGGDIRRYGTSYHSEDVENGGNCCESETEPIASPPTPPRLHVPSSDSPRTNSAHTAVSKENNVTLSTALLYLGLRVFHAGLTGLNYGLSLMLMLVAMTFNPGLFVSLVVGYIIGDFIFFARIREISYSDCH